MTYDELKAYIDGKFILTPNQVEAIKTATDKVGDDIEDLKAQLKKEKTGTKFFLDLGAAAGFKGDTGYNFGVCGDFGVRLGKGFLVKVGAQSMLAGIDDVNGFQFNDWSIKDTTVQACIGWEW